MIKNETMLQWQFEILSTSGGGMTLRFAHLPLPENPSESDSEQSDRNVASPLTFSPTYDLDGNATLVRTSTGTWQIAYNGENRPIRFENAAAETVVECGYDSQWAPLLLGFSRKSEKKRCVPRFAPFF